MRTNKKKKQQDDDFDDHLELAANPARGSNTSIYESSMMKEYVNLESATQTSYNLVPSKEMLPVVDRTEEKPFAWEIEFSDLVIEKEIGRGNFGQVSKGRWRGGEVAVKKLVSTLNSEQLRDFRQEIAIMCSLRPHPSVVQFFGASTKPGQPLCIVTEFLEGGSLLHLLQVDGQSISPSDMTKMAKGIASGMVHLISEKIIHRDLAARNILLTGSRTCKVSDFGMSRFGNTEDISGSTQTTVGPLRWMSPESISDGEYSEKTDVWSYGVTLYEIVSRAQIPYGQIKDPVQAAHKVAMGKVTLVPPEDCPPLLAELMRSCLQLEADSRPSFKSILSSFPVNE